jgi:hypothetical protein
MNGKRASIILGIFMAVVLLGGTLLQLFGGRNTTAQTVIPTTTPLPTFAPPPDVASVDFSQFYLHPTGVFAISQPTGFDQASPSSGLAIAQVNMVNNTSQSVIDAFVQDPGAAITAAGLSDFFTRESLAQTWRSFSSWTETNRAAGATDLTIDFSVTLSQQQFVARQRAWTDGTWIYSVRVLTPANATDYLVALLDGAASSMVGNTQFAGTPLNWTALYDPTSGAIIRHPNNWRVTDGGAGRPTTVTSPDNATLRVETRAGVTVDTPEAAGVILQQIRGNAVIAAVEPINRDATATSAAVNGFRVTYSSVTPDGEIQSGLADVLNGPDGMLYIAVLRAPDAALLDSAEATQEPGNLSDNLTLYRQIMDTFGVLLPLNWSATTVPPTPTPAATEAPAPETTAAPEAEVTPEIEVTAEATAAS